ncbi:MAG: hypothetical protein EHM64_05445 [Ignavibacteriae bacterium]|nr:MAG: hypothetical protein EHM64_05445 [Ignavibacteriota bacterium]
MHTRTFQLSALLLVLFSILCTQIPLLNYLGFEFSAATVLLAGYISGIFTLASWKNTSPERPPDVWRFIGRSTGAVLVLLTIPLLISLANILFVRNCSVGEGAKLYALTVIPGAIFSSALALLIGVVFGRWRKTAFSLLFILILLHIPAVTLLRPQLFAFNPIMGYFPGFTYDETLQVTQKLLTYRLATLAAAGSIAAASVWWWQRRRKTKEQSDGAWSSLPVAELIVLAVLVPAVVIVFTLSDRLGFSSSENFIRQKLAGNYKTTHFDIIYSAGSVKRERMEQIGQLHEFYFETLTREMNIRTQERITSFLYASPEQKGRLIGAANTVIAKPWLRQIHLNYPGFESSLKHEMAHVLAANFGWSPLKIAPNAGLTEGFAMAMGETSMIEEPLHRAASLVAASGVHPDPRSLFGGLGFFQANPSISYTLAGSFCRFLIDSFGIDQFKLLYGGGDERNLYHHDLNTLIGEWQASIKRIPLDGADSTNAKYYFRRPSIFGKECARVIANLNSETREYLAHHDFEQALNSADQSLNFVRTPEAVSQKAAALFEMRRFQDAAFFIDAQLRDTAIGFSLLPLRLRLGDAYWAMDSVHRARLEYEAMSALHLNSSNEEACAVRLEALKNPEERLGLQVYFTYTLEDTSRIARLERVTGPAGRYLLAREYAAKERYTESARLFASIQFPESKLLEFFRLQRLGKEWFLLQEFTKAKAAFVQSLPMAPNASLQLGTAEWIKRCEFCSK